ncbi:MAG: hypothetical protein GYA24_14285 [Candidatus Lokiarchaeota archaeon]|nr:hypothetical protein [Candidatus Lokiarchaeota archaeon]
MKMNPRYLAIITGLASLLFVIATRAVAGFLQGSDGTPDGAVPFSIEPVSLVIGLAGGALVAGIPAVAYTRSLRHKNKGWDGTVKGNQKIAAAGDGPKLINPIAMDKGLRVAGEPSPPGEGTNDMKETTAGKREFKGHVTLMK